MSGGTEALPDLGKHCQLPDCKQLDFLPFKCLGCHQVNIHYFHSCFNLGIAYSNTSTCKTCQLKVCLNHRFPAAHDCKKGPSVVPAAGAAASGWSRNKFLMAFASRTAKDCADQRSTSSSSSSSAPVKAR